MHDQFSRRSFARLIGAGVAASALPPMALIATGATQRDGGPLRLHFNENPNGPSPSARKALLQLADVAWQYPGDARDRLVSALATLHGVKEESILLGNGSSEILHSAGSTLTSPSKGVLVADPTYEALEQYATAAGAPVSKIPLTDSWAHDIARMTENLRGHAVVYICNPNNPTASTTPKSHVRALIAAAPPDVVVISDEAYAEYVTADDYESVVPLIEKHPNLLVLRTFSKIYGLAGLRIGYAIAQPQLLKRLHARQARNTLNAAGLSAALASLESPGYVEESRVRNAKSRDHALAQLQSLGFRTIPSHANFFMVDLGRDIAPVSQTMRSRGVSVGRPFPPLTHYLRVTVGTEAQMETFLSLFEEVIAGS